VRIAIYARRSPDDDPSKSVERQISHAASYALKKGWQVLEEHIYTDDGISGGEFQQRVGLLRLLNALKPRPPFNAVVMSEASRTRTGAPPDRARGAGSLRSGSPDLLLPHR
jgi:DNA invertase Pin-like site-specific DNA recombinase